MSNRTQPTAALTACHTVALRADDAQRGTVPLVPIGTFRSVDGRPEDAPHWVLTDARAREIAAELTARAARGTEFLIDFEHQTMLSRENGKPAPAAAWYRQFAVQGGMLCAINVRYVPGTREMLAREQYKYVSPVFTYEAGTGAVQKLMHAALTNNPGLDGMAVALRAALSSPLTPTPSPTTGATHMDALLAILRQLFGLPAEATPEAVLPHLTKLSADLGTGGAVQLAALKQRAESPPDPAKFVPIEAHQAAMTELGTLRQAALTQRIDNLVKPALADGRLLPAQEAWARSLGTSNEAALTTYLDTTKPIAALSGTQTQGKPPGDAGAKTLNADELAMCSMMGLSHEAYLKQRDGGAVAA